MLVSFEGQDGAGKTSLMNNVRTELEWLGIPTVAVPEFSDSPYGERLIEAVARDKFLRPVPGEPATVLTRALEEIADLYYLDEQVIGPASERAVVVLKDRWVDTILYTLAPLLVTAGAVPDLGQAGSWLRALLRHVRHRPEVTVVVHAPLWTRIERITNRRRELREDRACEVSADDIEVFAGRDTVIKSLIHAEPERFLLVENGDRPMAEGVGEIIVALNEKISEMPSGGGV